ncbi:MAG: alpha-xenorhabdolysin family binary toxin subunit A [Alkalinema sp. RU_4_3]|nr:alpha-xenorhabdolysin family binary toxin subunit A [Alkalinema sp. RU_4_3]
MTLFVPSSRLLIASGDSQQAQKFILSSKEWFNLQNQVQAVLALPSDLGEYEQRYGDASSGLQMKECFDAMHNLRNVATKYGNPKSFRAQILKNPNFLANAERPRHNAYSATLWTIEQAHQNAFSLASALRSIPVNARGEKSAEVVAGIKSLFLDADQIVDRMQQTVEQLDVLIREFQSLEDELLGAQTAMKTYTERSSRTRVELDREIGGLRTKIEQLERDRNAAYDKWLALTISACILPAVIGIVGVGVMVILAVPTGGASFAVGSAVTAALAGLGAAALGTAAGIARTSYDSLVQETISKQEFLQKRITYRYDLGALDNSMKFVMPTSNGIIGQLKVIRDAWASSLGEIRFKVADLSTETLLSGDWLDEQKMLTASANWLKVDNMLKVFVNGSFVDADVLTFGQSLPQDNAKWQKELVLQLAA